MDHDKNSGQADSGLRTLSIVVENRFGALLKIVGTFSARSHNIERLNVVPSSESGVSLVTVTFPCDSKQCDQLARQLRKLLEVVEVRDTSANDSVNSLVNGGYSNGSTDLLRTAR